MKLHPEDPRLTAFVLGELKPDDAAAVERTAAEDPAVQAAIDELDGMGQLLTDTLFATKPKLRPAQRQAILQAAADPSSIRDLPKIADHRPSWKPWIASLAAAALVVFSLIIFTRVEFFDKTVVGGKPLERTQPVPSPATSGEDEWRTIPVDIALLPAPGPADASRVARTISGGAAASASVLSKAVAARNAAIAKASDGFYREVAERFKNEPVPAASDLPALTRRGSVVASMAPQLQLPVQAGSVSLEWVSRSVRENHKLPPANAVRIEEILNHFAIRPAGPAAVAQGVTLSTETLPCPWKPSASLLIVALRGAVDDPREVQATFKADTAGVSRYRLLGFAPVTGAPDANLPTYLPAKALTLIAIEIEPVATATRFGTVEWTVNGQPAPPVSLVRQADAEPSDDARFASLLCTYGQWLAGDQAGLIDGEIVAALAREVAADNLPPDRFDLLNLIDQSLNL